MIKLTEQGRQTADGTHSRFCDPIVSGEDLSVLLDGLECDLWPAGRHRRKAKRRVSISHSTDRKQPQGPEKSRQKGHR